MSVRDPHVTLSPTEAQGRGCICEFGCRNCGMHITQMGNCPAWDPCPIGREADPTCLLDTREDADVDA